MKNEKGFGQVERWERIQHVGAQGPDGMYFQRTESWPEVGAEGVGREALGVLGDWQESVRAGASQTTRFRLQPKNFGLPWWLR